METVPLIERTTQDEDKSILFVPVLPGLAGAAWQGNDAIAPANG